MTCQLKVAVTRPETPPTTRKICIRSDMPCWRARARRATSNASTISEASETASSRNWRVGSRGIENIPLACRRRLPPLLAGAIANAADRLDQIRVLVQRGDLAADRLEVGVNRAVGHHRVVAPDPVE